MHQGILEYLWMCCHVMLCTRHVMQFSHTELQDVRQITQSNLKHKIGLYLDNKTNVFVMYIYWIVIGIFREN